MKKAVNGYGVEVPLTGASLSARLRSMSRTRFQDPELEQTSTSNGNDRWFIRVRVDELQSDGTVKRVAIRHYLGSCSTVTKIEAGRKRVEYLATLNDPQQTVANVTTFGGFASEYLKLSEVGMRPNSFRNCTSVVNFHIKPAFDNVLFADLTEVVAAEWIQSLSLVRSTRYLVLKRARTIWKKAISMRLTKLASPFDFRLKVEVDERRELADKATIIRTIEAVKQKYQNVLMFTLYTGLRISEVLGLRFSDITTASGEPCIKVARMRSVRGEVLPPKSAKAKRNIPIGDLQEYIRQDSKDAGEYLFPMLYGAVQRAMVKAARKTGIYYKGFGEHELRRCSVTWGRPFGSVAASMAQHGHADIRTNELYDKSDTDLILERAEIQRKLRASILASVAKT